MRTRLIVTSCCTIKRGFFGMERDSFVKLYEKYSAEYEETVNRLAFHGKERVGRDVMEASPWYFVSRRLGVEKGVWERMLADLKDVMDVSDEASRTHMAEEFCTKWKEYLFELKRKERFTEELLQNSANVTRTDSVNRVNTTVYEIRSQMIDYEVEADVVNRVLLSMQYETQKLKNAVGGFV